MVEMMGRELAEAHIVKLNNGEEAIAVRWINPGQLMRLLVTLPNDGAVDLEVTVIGLLVKKRESRGKGKGKKKTA